MICPDFAGLKVLVVGDPMIDEYHFGHVDRVSPEAPVPVFIPDKIDSRMGGAANVYEQLVALGCEPKSGWDWDTPPTGKRRFMVGSHQLLRVDEDRCVPNAIPALDGFRAVVISDYAKGACTHDLCSQVISGALKRHIPVVVDPKGTDWTKYEGCTVICPNEHEVAVWNGEPTCGRMIMKRGAKGLLLSVSGGREYFPAQAKHVFDVTGAGDTVTAVIAACLAVKVDLPTACRLANLAAGYVVGEVGTTVCPIETLQALCKESE